MLLSREPNKKDPLGYRDFILCLPSVKEVNNDYKNHPDENLRKPVKILCDPQTYVGPVIIEGHVFLEMLRERHCLVPMEAEYEVGCCEGLMPWRVERVEDLF